MRKCADVLFRTPVLFLILAADLQAAPITFNTALPVAEDQYVIRLQLKAAETRTGRVFPKPHRKMRAAVGVIGYGISSDLTIFGVLPYIDKKLELAGPDREADGIADVSLFARYTLYKNNLPGRTFRIAPFLGVSLTSGSDNESDSAGKVPAGLQPGSGSTDFFAGLVLTYQTLAWEFDSQIRLDDFNAGNGLEKGYKVSLAASLQYRIWPVEIKSATPGFLYLVLESEFNHQQKDRVAGLVNDNSGGNRWLLAPGVQYVTRRWVAELSFQFPVRENLNGSAPESHYAINGGFRWNF